MPIFFRHDIFSPRFFDAAADAAFRFFHAAVMPPYIDFLSPLTLPMPLFFAIDDYFCPLPRVMLFYCC